MTNWAEKRELTSLCSNCKLMCIISQYNHIALRTAIFQKKSCQVGNVQAKCASGKEHILAGTFCRLQLGFWGECDWIF